MKPGRGKSDIHLEARLKHSWERLVKELKEMGTSALDREPLIAQLVKLGMREEVARARVDQAFREAGIE